MKQDEARAVLDEAVAELHQALGEGRSERLERYLEVMSRFHRYSFGNVLMILAQMPSASRICGYRRWQAFGRQVKQGERGIAIFAPLIRRNKNFSNDDEAVLFGFRVAYVFDVSQTDGEPLAEFATVCGNPEQHLEQIESLIRSQGIELAYGPLPPGTLGCSSGGRITIRLGLTPAERFSIAVHELVHLCGAFGYVVERRRELPSVEFASMGTPHILSHIPSQFQCILGRRGTKRRCIILARRPAAAFPHRRHVRVMWSRNLVVCFVAGTQEPPGSHKRMRHISGLMWSIT